MDRFFFFATHKHSWNLNISIEYNYVRWFIHTHYNVDLYLQVAMSMHTTLTSNSYHSKYAVENQMYHVAPLRLSDSGSPVVLSALRHRYPSRILISAGSQEGLFSFICALDYPFCLLQYYHRSAMNHFSDTHKHSWNFEYKWVNNIETYLRTLIHSYSLQR